VALSNFFVGFLFEITGSLAAIQRAIPVLFYSNIYSIIIFFSITVGKREAAQKRKRSAYNGQLKTGTNNIMYFKTCVQLK